MVYINTLSFFVYMLLFINILNEIEFFNLALIKYYIFSILNWILFLYFECI